VAAMAMAKRRRRKITSRHGSESATSCADGASGMAISGRCEVMPLATGTGAPALGSGPVPPERRECDGCAAATPAPVKPVPLPLPDGERLRTASRT
jgi:hypothetical protein